MDTKKLEALLLAVERGSLTAAAEEMGYTQSGLTNMMNSLEGELGLELLIRSKSGVRLTAAGEALLPYMQSLRAESRALEQAIRTFRQGRADTLRLGAYSSVARQWLPAMLAEFRKEYPDTDVPMAVGGIPDIFDKLRGDDLDCAIVSYSAERCHGLHYIPLRDDPLVAVLPGAYRPEASAFPVSGFSGVEFLMPSAGFEADITPVFGQRVENVASRVRYTNLDDAAIVSMVEHKLGVSILSELVMQDMPYNVRTLPLDPPSCRRLGIAMAETRSGDPKIQRFVDCAQRVIGALYA
ncbi:MAG: LysR family transcriptional regulator [Oscillospiraceae bacterium]|nr:LysR family transcriptional regulator [Oscillospiraceae bacterium]